MTSRAFAKDAPQPSNSNSCKVTTNGIGYNYNPFDGRYFTQSGIEFWDDFEITNEWHTIATQGTNDYQAAVVYWNYFVKIIFEDRTNKVQLNSTLLPLEKVPMRCVLHVNQVIINDGGGSWAIPYPYDFGKIMTNHVIIHGL